MDLRSYYRQIREQEAQLTEGDQVVVSLATKDGGREGVTSEVPRPIAAKLIVEQRARLATDEEREQHYARERQQREAYEEQAALKRVHVQVMNEMEQAATGKKPNRR